MQEIGVVKNPVLDEKNPTKNCLLVEDDGQTSAEEESQDEEVK